MLFLSHLCANKMESEASFNAARFPFEIITEILSRLQVKSLLRFKSVSKCWFSLICSPHFIKIHLNLSANKEDNHHLLILDDLDGGYRWGYKECPVPSLFVDSVTQALDLGYPLKDGSRLFYTIGSCNGLVLLDDDSTEYLVLWNPTIRKYKKLPDFRPKWKHSAHYSFGYDEFHDDYKVVGVFYPNIAFGMDNSVDAEVKVYSLKSNSWTSVNYSGESFFIKTSAGDYEETLAYYSVFVDGKLHWDTYTSDPNVPKSRNIISFDIANEKWDKLEKPSYEVGEIEWCVDKLGSDLCVFSHYKETHLGVWVMKQYGVKKSWIKKFTIRFPDGQQLYSPYFISNKGEMLLSVGRHDFMIYNSKDDSFRHPDVTNIQDAAEVKIYIESLVSPFSTEGTENAEKKKAEKSLDQNNRATINL